jgi:hypothetical protein
MKKVFIVVIACLLSLPTAGHAKAPNVTTLAALNITIDAATLNGQVDPQGGSDISYNFEYGLTSAYGNTTHPQPKTGQAAENVSFNLTGLLPNATYHYRIVARNARNETGQGADMTFKTLPKKPDATTLAASNVSSNTATLNGQVNPNGDNTTYFFIYGLSGGYRQQAPMTFRPPLTGRTPVHVYASITVPSDETLHYKIVAQNSAGQSQGADMTFKTSPSGTTTPMPVVTGAATNVTASRITLNGQVPAQLTFGSKYYFEWGTNTAYGKTTKSTALSQARSKTPVSVSATLTGPFRRGATYHYRVVVVDSAGKRYFGKDEVFRIPMR